MAIQSKGGSLIPHLERTADGAARLIVDGQPYIVLGGELHNSSSSSRAYMEPIWPRLAGMQLNTVLAAVSWELIEPLEGRFDFTIVDELIADARSAGLRLILLWFGSWKNSFSTYTPGWVKTDLQRFPRMKLRTGQVVGTISCFSREACEADARAFAALMRHLRETDGDHHTVIMVQVENEAGLLGSPRDYSDEAECRFGTAVPEELAQGIAARGYCLLPELDGPWAAAGKRQSGTWSEMFGAAAEEVFMAWHIARYVNEVAAAGREEYALPLFANAWTVQHEGELPGQYPSGGPVSRMLDVWQCAAPAIELLAPDIYLPDFPAECASYTRSGNLLFIPEARNDRWAAANVFYAIGKHHAIGFSPFGIDSVDADSEPVIGNAVQSEAMKRAGVDVGRMLGRSYRLLKEMMPILTRCYGTDRMTGVLQFGPNVQALELGGYVLRITFSRPVLDDADFPGAGILIAESDREYIVAGHGFSVDFLAKPGDLPHVEFLAIEEGVYREGAWVPGRRLNGDEYGVRLGAEPGVIRVSVFSY